jgi:hypothetical protein
MKHAYGFYEHSPKGKFLMSIAKKIRTLFGSEDIDIDSLLSAKTFDITAKNKMYTIENIPGESRFYVDGIQRGEKITLICLRLPHNLVNMLSVYYKFKKVPEKTFSL